MDIYYSIIALFILILFGIVYAVYANDMKNQKLIEQEKWKHDEDDFHLGI